MLSKDGFVKILDFGLAKLVETEAERAVGSPDGNESGNDHGHRRVHVARAGRRQGARLPVGPVFLRGDSLRDGDRQTRLSARHGRRNADCDHSGRAAVRFPAPAEEPSAAAVDHRELPREDPRGTLRLDEGSRAGSRDSSRLSSGRTVSGEIAAAARTRRSRGFSAALVSARDDPLRALRSRRTDGHLRRRVRRKSVSPLLDPAREPGVERVDAARRRNPVDLRQRADGDLARAPGPGASSGAGRSRRCRCSAARRARSSKTSSGPTGRPTARRSRSSETSRASIASSFRRTRRLRDRRMGQSSAGVARRLARRVSDPSGSRQRHGLGLRRRPERPRPHALG